MPGKFIAHCNLGLCYQVFAGFKLGLGLRLGLELWLGHWLVLGLESSGAENGVTVRITMRTRTKSWASG